MSISTVPTLDILTVEGLKMAGYPNATANDDYQTRAEEWVQELFNDVRQNWQGRKMKALMIESYTVTAIGVSRYANPDDFEAYKDISILFGNISGTAQDGAVGSVTLKATDTTSENTALGRTIVITAGLGVGSASQISAFDTTTKVATVTPNFTTAPDNTSTYMIIDNDWNVRQKEISVLKGTSSPFHKGRPTDYFPVGQANADSDETGEFQLFPVPDKIYPLKIRYYVNPELLDLTTDANLLTTLYRRWRTVIIQKVMYKAMKTDRRTEEGLAEERVYKNMLSDLISKEIYGHNLSNLQTVVDDGSRPVGLPTEIS